MRKITIEIDEDLYQAIIPRLHHGQLSFMMRKIFKSLDLMSKRFGWQFLWNWLYNDHEDLVLFSEEGIRDVVDGENRLDRLHVTFTELSAKNGPES